MNDEDLLQLANAYDFSGGVIQNIVRKATMHQVIHGIHPDINWYKDTCKQEYFNKNLLNSIGFKNKIMMSFKEFTVNLTSSSNEIILLEGTRKLAESDAPKLIALAQQLATKYPRCIFRTGNATGSDEAFAKGIALVDPTRLEYVLPATGMGKRD